MLLKIGMYVRAKDGMIAKYIDHENSDEHEQYCFDSEIYWFYEYYEKYIDQDEFENWFKNEVIATSYVLIDLIKLEDYVNGYKVIDMGYNIENEKYIIIDKGSLDGLGNVLYDRDIKFVKSKEQFENGMYVVGEDK